MNPAITTFIEFLNETIRITLANKPDYTQMPASSPSITYYTHEGMYARERIPRWTDDQQKLSIAEKLVTEEARTERVSLALLGFEQHLEILGAYLKNNEATVLEKNFLLKSLDNYLKASPVTTSYVRYTYTITEYNDDDMDYRGWPVSHHIRCPTGSAGENLELNTLASLALQRLSNFNRQQINDQLPPKPRAIHAKLSIIPASKEKNEPRVMQPTLFDWFANSMMITSDELERYQGLARLKADPAFIDSLTKQLLTGIETSQSPQGVRDSIAYKMAATARNPSVFTFFGGTHTQNIFEKAITANITSRQQLAVLPSAPIYVEPGLAIATPVDNTFKECGR